MSATGVVSRDRFLDDIEKDLLFSVWMIIVVDGIHVNMRRKQVIELKKFGQLKRKIPNLMMLIPKNERQELKKKKSLVQCFKHGNAKSVARLIREYLISFSGRSRFSIRQICYCHQSYSTIGCWRVNIEVFPPCRTSDLYRLDITAMFAIVSSKIRLIFWIISMEKSVGFAERIFRDDSLI